MPWLNGLKTVYNDFVGTREVFDFNPLMRSFPPSLLAFLPLCPFFFWECLCDPPLLSAQIRFQVPWGSSLALPHGSERAPRSQTDPGYLQLPPCFYCVPLSGSSAEAMLQPDKKPSSCFGAAIAPRGDACCGGGWSSQGRAASAGTLTAFCALCWGLPLLLASAIPSVRLNYPSRRSEMSFGVHPENFALM